jgi:cyclopropane fatty-acyl-phospholipid synthase-like methyltransferase
MIDQELSRRFPRSHNYSFEWIREGGMGSHPLWLAEWLSQSLDLQPRMRVLDLGCGKAKSSVFLAREFGLEVWAADLWVSPSENFERIRDAGLLTSVPNGGRVIPLRVDAHKLPFAAEFFDAIVAHDCYSYYGTDDLYLNYLVQFVKPGGQIGIAGAGLVQEITPPPPAHLAPIWSTDFWCLHSADWWRHHWSRTGLVEVELADSMPDASAIWSQWQRQIAPDNHAEIAAVEADAGHALTYIRMTARRNPGVELQPYCWPDASFSLPHTYQATEIAARGGQE